MMKDYMPWHVFNLPSGTLPVSYLGQNNVSLSLQSRHLGEVSPSVIGPEYATKLSESPAHSYLDVFMVLN